MRNSLANFIHSLQMPERESRVLGELIDCGDPNNEIIHQAMLILSKECFTSLDSSRLFSLIHAQYKRNESFEITFMMDIIPRDPDWAQTYEYFAQVASSQKSYSSLIADCEKLKKLYRSRRALLCLMPMVDKINENRDPDFILETINECVINMGLEYESEKIKPKTILEIADLYFQGHYSKQKKAPTGLETLDHPLRLNGGFNNGSLVTIAGQSGHGKTHFALYVALNMGLQQPDKQVLFYNLEMTEESIMARYFSLKTSTHFDKLTHDDKMIAYLDRKHANINVYPTQTKNLNDIITTAKYQHTRLPVGLIVVDYIGLVDLSDNPEQHHLRQVLINSRLAELAIELNCVVIAASQVNRNASRRADKRPLIADSADSMGSQRSSSYWLGVYLAKMDDNNSPMKDIFNVRCLKNREGLLFDVNFLWNNSCLKECDHQTGYEIGGNPFEGLCDSAPL